MPKIPSEEREPEDGEELVRLFIEALAREAAQYEFRCQLEQARKIKRKAGVLSASMSE